VAKRKSQTKPHSTLPAPSGLDSEDFTAPTTKRSPVDADQNRKISYLEDRVKRGEKWMIVLTAAMVLLGGVQLWLTRKQISDAAAGTRLDQRAWVVVTDVEGGRPAVGQTLTPTIVFKNIGKTPAREVRIRHRYAPVQRGYRPHYPQFESDYQPIDGLDAPAVLPPEGVGSIGHVLRSTDNITPLVFTEDIIQKWSKGEFAVYLLGRITYRDIFDHPHWMTYCFIYTPQGEHMVCEQNNDFDRD
jgi:hypothetical protein